MPLLKASPRDGQCSLAVQLSPTGSFQPFNVLFKGFFLFRSVFSSPLMHFPAEVLLRVGISVGERYQLQSVTLNDAAWEQEGIPLTGLRLVCCSW